MRTTLHTCTDHVCIILLTQRSDTRHRVEVDRIRVLEEKHAVKVISVDPFLDDPILSSHSTQTNTR